MDTPLCRELGAALDALAKSPPGASDAAQTLTTLALLGDALRSGLTVPAPLRAWWYGLATGRLSDSVLALHGEVDRWSLPVSHDPEGDDPHLDFVLRLRDQAESVRVAAVGACVASGRAPASLDGLQPLSESLARFDRALGVVVDRSQVGPLLLDRAELLRGPSWVDGLPLPSVPAGGSIPMNSGLRAAAGALAPSDESVALYLTRGERAALVEGAARSDARFAADLAAVFDGLDGAGEPLALAAWCWRKKQGRAVAAVALSVRPPRRLAAADGAAESAGGELDLGVLAPLAAEGKLLCTATTATLRVFGDPADVARVTFGGASTASPNARGAWEVSVPAGEGPLVICVVSPAGAEFRADVELVARQGVR